MKWVTLIVGRSIDPIGKMELSAANQAKLRELEERLLQPEVRADPRILDQLLAPEFREFGQSGREYDKAQTIELLLREPLQGRTEIEDFHALALADGLALVTYRSVSRVGASTAEQRALRSSIWRQGVNGWLVVFHQGTPVENRS